MLEHPLPLLSDRDRRSAQALIEGAGLRFEQDFDDLLGVFRTGRPLDPASRAYSQIMKRRLDRWGIRLLEVERKKVNDLWISTRRVRKALAAGDRLEVAALVPETTATYLSTPEAARFLQDAGGWLHHHTT